MIILGLTYIIALFFMLIFKKKYLKFVYIGLIGMLAIIAFNFDPIKAYYIKGNYTDLVRFYDALNHTRIYGYNYLINHSDYSSLFIARWYVYILSFFEKNGIFAVVTCLLEYGLILYTINNFSKKNNSSKLSVVLSTLFFLLTIDYVMNVANVRTPLVFSIYFFCIYKEFIEYKRSKLFLLVYVLLCFLHPIAIVLLMFRIIIIFYNKYTSKVINIILLSWSLIYNFLLPLLAKISTSQYISQLSAKLNYYDNSKENIEVILILFSIIKIILCYLMLKYFIKKIRFDVVNKYKSFYNLANILTFFTLGSYFQYHMFLRLPVLLTFFLSIFIQFDFGNVKNLKYEEEYDVRQFHILKRYIYCLLILLICVCFSLYYFGGYSYRRLIF